MQARGQSAYHLARMFTRYIGVGGAAFLVDLCVFLFSVRSFGLDPKVAQVISRTVGALVSLGGHRYFSFAQRHDSGKIQHLSRLEVVAFTGLTIFGIFFSPFLLQFIISHITGNLIPAKILNEGVMMCINFIAMRAIFLKKV